MVRAMSLVGCKNFIVDKPEQIKDSAIVLPAGILVFTDEKTLKHKKIDGREDEGEYCYWGTNKIPKKFIETLMLENSPRVSCEQSRYEMTTNGFAIYLAVKGKIKGYFIVHDVEDGDEHLCWLIFYSETWHEIKDGEVLKPAQGWRYYPR